ncbi:MAG: methylenetetrahydrofolate reductase [Nanoarchaeota archaeon]
MKVTEHIAQRTGPLISFELVPPKRGGGIDNRMALIDALTEFHPPYIDVTSHSSELIYDETSQGIRKRTVRKRPGTTGLLALIQQGKKIDAVAHALCKGFTREETEDFLIELSYFQVENVLALGGDGSYNKQDMPGRTRNEHAVDLVRQIVAMNQGVYLDNLVTAEKTNFCIGVAGYPEKHRAAPNLRQDVRFLLDKIDAGASYVVTQMFFDNAAFFHFRDVYALEARERSKGRILQHYAREVQHTGSETVLAAHADELSTILDQYLAIPIIPGLRILTSKKQLTSLPDDFSITIPPALYEAAMAEDPDKVIHVGVGWALEQVTELFKKGSPNVHFFVMENAKPIQLFKEAFTYS